MGSKNDPCSILASSLLDPSLVFLRQKDPKYGRIVFVILRGATRAEVLKAYPQLTTEAVEEVLKMGTWLSGTDPKSP